MRSVPILLLAALAWPVFAAAQSIIPSDMGWQSGAPNARAAQRPVGPNARAAQRPMGPNMAIVMQNKARGGEVYPACSSLGAVRARPIRRGEPGYARHLDADGDGIACEQQKAPASLQRRGS